MTEWNYFGYRTRKTAFRGVGRESRLEWALGARHRGHADEVAVFVQVDQDVLAHFARLGHRPVREFQEGRVRGARTSGYWLHALVRRGASQGALQTSLSNPRVAALMQNGKDTYRILTDHRIYGACSISRSASRLRTTVIAACRGAFGAIRPSPLTRDDRLGDWSQAAPSAPELLLCANRGLLHLALRVACRLWGLYPNPGTERRVL